MSAWSGPTRTLSAVRSGIGSMLTSAPVVGATVAVIAIIAAGCTIDGTPSRAPVADPVRCSAAECPELASPDVHLGESGVTEQNWRTAVPAYVGAVLDDLDTAWGQWSGELNIERIPPVREIIESGRTFLSKCDGLRVESDTANAFYCPLDRGAAPDGGDTVGAVILPTETFAAIWQGNLLGQRSVLLGDFAVATIIAHEYGHNMVYRLWRAYDAQAVERYLRGEQPRAGDLQLPQGSNNELIADCLAGNWAATVFARDSLGITDMAQAVAMLMQLSYAPNGDHGSRSERFTALATGFGGAQLSKALGGKGRPVDCLTKYWPQVLRA